MINKIFSFFKNPIVSKREVLDGAYFHDDFYRQIELFPLENWKYLAKENKQIEAFKVEHSDGNGLATAVYSIEGNEILEIIEKQILRNEVEILLLNLGLNKIEKVYSGYIPNNYKCENLIAYNFESAEIFIEYQNEIIKHIYLNEFRFQENEEIKTKLREILFEIGVKFDLILNDWNLAETINLKDKKEIEKYLNE
jgi:hypothetical protein